MERNVLLFSGRPPVHSAGFVQDTINILELAGCNVDFITLYEFRGQKRNQFNILKRPRKLRFFDFWGRHPFLRIFKPLYHFPYQVVSKFFNRGISLMHGKYLLVFEKEEEPPICPDLIFEKIQKQYDYFVIMIAQDIITSKTIQLLYDKYQKPIIIISPDMYYFAGNCFFPNDCTHYLNECRNCPAYKEIGLPDSAHSNFLYKKKVFESIRCAFFCNTHDANFIRQSGIISENKLFLSSFFLDIDVFKPYDNEFCKKKFHIPAEKTFIIMARYISPQNLDWKRKGGTYLVETLSFFYNMISEKERSQCLLFFVGTDKIDTSIDIKLDTLCVGNLKRSDLILAYNASSVFFCPSINDSGPSMVNQSMACSTPVVAFNQGTALDVIEDGVTGLKVDLFDTKSLSNALLAVMRMPTQQYQELRRNARNKAIDCNSLNAGANYFQRIFESFESSIL